MSRPSVSICVPAFNAARFIDECLGSALNQSHRDHEIVVYDNASSDDTWKRVTSYDDPRIRYFRADVNTGMARNFNRVVAEARGELVKVLCADDALEARALEEQVEFLNGHPNLSAVTSARRIMDEDGRFMGVTRWFHENVVVDAKGLRAAALIYGNIVGEPSAVLFRKQAWEAAGLWGEGLSTLIDLDMWLRLSLSGPVGFLSADLCRIRRHKRSMTNQLVTGGNVSDVVLRSTARILSDLDANPRGLVGRVSLGKVAGSYVKNSILALVRGNRTWPLSALRRALLTDPCLAGLALYLSLFRPGLLGVRPGPKGLEVCLLSTLRCVGVRP